VPGLLAARAVRDRTGISQGNGNDAGIDVIHINVEVRLAGVAELRRRSQACQLSLLSTKSFR